VLVLRRARCTWLLGDGGGGGDGGDGPAIPSSLTLQCPGGTDSARAVCPTCPIRPAAGGTAHDHVRAAAAPRRCHPPHPVSDAHSGVRPLHPHNWGHL